MSNEKRIRELRRDLQKKSVPFHNVFSSPEGQEVLSVLKEEYDGLNVVGQDEYVTVVRAAQRDVVRYIETMIKLREENYE